MDDDDFFAILMITSSDTSGLNWKGIIIWLVIVSIAITLIVLI